MAIEARLGGSMKFGTTPGGGMPEGVLVGSSNWSMLKVEQDIFLQLLRWMYAMISNEF